MPRNRWHIISRNTWHTFTRNGWYTFPGILILGNILVGDLGSKTAVKLVREWFDLRVTELENDWELAMAGKEIKKINPLD